MGVLDSHDIIWSLASQVQENGFQLHEFGCNSVRNKSYAAQATSSKTEEPNLFYKTSKDAFEVCTVHSQFEVLQKLSSKVQVNIQHKIS